MTKKDAWQEVTEIRQK